MIQISEENKAMFWSWIRSAITASLAIYIALGLSPWEIEGEAWKDVAAAGIASLVMTVFNYFGTWETRYGRQKPTPPDAG
jgi:hypothetical protein